MKYIKSNIADVIVVESKIFKDSRGYFFESFQNDIFVKHVREIKFVQENESMSYYGSLRGLHYQIPPFTQSKLVRVVIGKVLDIAVDIRKGSPTFGKYVSIKLSGDNKKQLLIPRGFAHGFVVLSKEAIFQYKVDNYYSKIHERGIIYNDPSLNIDWHIKEEDFILSEKDKQYPSLHEAELLNYKAILYE